MANLLLSQIHPGHPYVVYGGHGAAPLPQTFQEKITQDEYLTKQATIHAKNLKIYEYNSRQETNNNHLLPPPLIRTCPPIIPRTYHRYLNESWNSAINRATMIISMRERIAQRTIANTWRYKRQYKNKQGLYMRCCNLIIIWWFHAVVIISHNRKYFINKFSNIPLM